MSGRRLVAAVLALCAIIALPPAVHAQPTSGGVTQVRLDNGLAVLVRENPVAPVVAVALLVRMGTRWETRETAGLSNFVHAVMVKGTSRRTGADLAEAVAGLGGKISASGEIDYSGIQGTALARFWRELLGLTAELALEPKLAADEVDRERDWLLGRIQRRRDNAPSRAFDEYYATLYGDHPYAIPSLGTLDSLRRLDQAAIVAAYRRFYRPERMVLAVSGQVSAPDVVAEARRLFGGMAPGGAAADPPIPPPVAAAHRVIIEQAANQTQIVAGGLAPSLAHPDHAAVKVLSTVLGGGMAGRLFVELRDKSALAYTATAYYDPMREPGTIILYLGTAPENAARAEEALLAEIRRVQGQPVTNEELRRAKAYVLGRYAMDRRTNERQAWYLAFYEVEGVGLEYPERFRRAVEAVTAADVLRAAKTHLAPLTTLILGPRAPR
ncbi:MAG TPA: pitrilysin family protein [Methylomirabilota bacterium]|jgi:predicted Zn-dependent peptidase|nr:pitrilysin family protein [Methylomirabilota bacterium]